ncbi:hypothetical protein [Sulfurovum sp.]|uniref:hypothetical protein n=1 Tax=Sulfurovum sp. TaxID=1969726 RepID=UPI0035665714
MSKSVGELSIDELKEIILSVPKTYFVEEVERIVAKKFEEERKIFWVPAEQHYNQHKMLDECADRRHDWTANHEFVSSMRKRGQKAWNVGFYMAVVACCGFIASVFMDGFRHAVVDFFSGR